MVATALLLSACAPQAMLQRVAVGQLADQLASQGSAGEDDLGLAREASAFYLKLSESVLRQKPAHLPLAEAVAGGFTQYSYAFVAAEADRVQAVDAKAGQRLRERAARLYWRARGHAMTALALNNPALVAALSSQRGPAALADLQLPAEQVGIAYWAAASWGAFIALSKDKPEAVADLPQVVELARLAWRQAPQHGAGALASLLGVLEAARPGGSLQQAQTYFDAAIVAGAGRSAGPYVAKAESLAWPAADRVAFEALLHQALAVAQAERNVANEVMRERAQWLLDSADDMF